MYERPRNPNLPKTPIKDSKHQCPSSAYWVKPDEPLQDKSLYKAISVLAVDVIGREQILAMSAPQVGLLNKSLNRIIERRRTIESVTREEIEGAYEMIMVHVLPTGSHEHLM